ncbi:MAG TPA: aldo/keto reductase [Usitatibacter sp.]|jgi:aryl-alcohol dehydrogenase (NADP+)|nr:aldo/keto reductase [Usitatibacter sp.]
MEYRKLGESGLMVSPLCLGTMMFGDRTDKSEAGRIVAAARDAGVNFIDTADVYAKGESERITGALIAPDRDRWILATKVANPMGDDPNRRGTSRKWILRAIDESLERLGTDYVDIYYLHKDVHETPLAETIAAIADVIGQGKARYFGVSNYRGWRIAEVMHLCREMGIDKPAVCQPYYNAMNRQPENDILPACHYYGIGVVPYSPLARGVLTGKYAKGEAPAAETRAGRQDKRILETEFRDESLEIARKLKAHAERKGLTAVDYAVNWVLNNRIVSSVIAGPRTLEQWQAYVGAIGKRFDAEDESLLDSMVPAGHASTPGYNDPAYPLIGRIAR